MAMGTIPIYVQYYDEKQIITTKEVSHKDGENGSEREIGMPLKISLGGTVSIKFYDSDIKYAVSLANKWCKRNNINVMLSTYIFTTDAEKDWWTFQPRQSSFMGGIYRDENMSMYKSRGVGIIIRDYRLPSIENNNGRKQFVEKYIPI